MNTIEPGADRDQELPRKPGLLDEHRLRVDREQLHESRQADAGNDDTLERTTNASSREDLPVPHEQNVDLKKTSQSDRIEADSQPRSNDTPQEAPFNAPPSLAKRYLIAGQKYYFRDDVKKVAFEDQGKRLSTDLDDPAVATSMVELAVAKEWTSVHVKGTAEFKREVWLTAAARGMKVSGYTPSDVDLARLDDLIQRQPLRPTNEIVKNDKRERTFLSEKIGLQAESATHETKDESKPLTAKQQLAIDALKAILRSRGDSEVAINMASALAAEKFTDNRVYVGKLVESGYAPYDNNPVNDPNFFVKLKGVNGERTIWGEDIRRALALGGASKGDDISLAHQGMKAAKIRTKRRDEFGKRTEGYVEKIVDRNDWEVTKLDTLQEVARQRIVDAAAVSLQRTGKQPRLNVYDQGAPRRINPEIQKPLAKRAKSKDPNIPR